MKIPKYIINLMKRSYYYYDFNIDDERCAAGYTVAIKKATPYTHLKTFSDEINRLKKWVEKQDGGVCHIIHFPGKTTYGTQIAIVTIFDPVMKLLEDFISP